MFAFNGFTDLTYIFSYFDLKINFIQMKSFCMSLNLCQFNGQFVPTSPLTLIWVGFLGVRFEAGEGIKLHPTSPPPLSKTRQNYATNFKFGSTYTPICYFRKYIFQYLGSLNFADVIIFLQNITFFPKKVPLLKAIV